ncbi:MAG: AAA family ATPase [Cyclobacteriaceae bacterium]
MDRATIMEHTGQGLDVFRHYIPADFKVGKALSSPLREDKHPSFSIFKDDQGIYRWKDFATDQSGDAIDFTMVYFGVDYPSAVSKIVSDFCLNTLGGHVRTDEVRTSNYSFKKDFDGFELDFWSKYGVNESQLVRYQVCALQQSRPDNPKFAYQFEWGMKIYQPNGKPRFYYQGKSDDDYIFGWEQLPDKGLYVVLSAGEKDTLTLAAREYPAISLNSETKEIPKELIGKLKRRFRYVLLCYDGDDAGVAAAKKHTDKHPGLIKVKLPLPGTKQSKDLSDYFTQGSTKHDFELLIRSSIKNKYRDTLHELSNNKFDFNKEIAEPIPVCTIGDQKILTLGNLGVIAGKAKSGKSATIQSILSGAIAREINKNYLGINVESNPNGLAVLHFDTEQSSFDYCRKIRNSIYDAGYKGNVSFFHSFHLLEFTPWERMRYIEHMVDYYSMVHGGIYLIIIDGVADLIKSVNDEEVANQIVDKLHQIATELNCGVLLVLHMNPDGGKTRGHLGSQLDRKAESVILIEKDGDVCTINPRYCRNASFSSLAMPQFKWSDDLKKFIYLGEKTHHSKTDKRLAESEDILAEAAKRALSWERPVLRKFICEVSGVGRTAAYDQINFMIENELLIENKDGDLAINI